MSNPIKKYIKYLIHKALHPNVKISLGAHVDNETSLGKNIVINGGCQIFKSNIGDGVSIGISCCVVKSSLEKNIRIGNNCFLSDISLGRFSYISQNCQLSFTELGGFCSIGPDLICGYGEHPTNYVSSSPVFFSTLKQCGVSFSDKDYFVEKKKVFIGHDVWIGARVFIRNGVNIGTGAIIGAGAVVVKDVPAYAVVGGVPAKIIQFRFPEKTVQALLESQWWNWSEVDLRKAQKYFSTSDVDSFTQWSKTERETSCNSNPSLDKI